MADEDLQTSEVDRAQVFGDIARHLESQADLAEVLRSITASSVDTVPGADYAGISLVKNLQEIESVAPTHDLVYQADQAQEELGEGPCLDAVWQHDTVRVDDLESEQRWPRYRERALALGVRSSLSFQLFTEGRNLGALNLYSGRSHAFGDESEHVGLVFASHAAVALRGSQKESQLKDALLSRDVIGMAKGILIERYKIDDDQAFQMLVQASQTAHVKLRNVADFLVRTGSTTLGS